MKSSLSLISLSRYSLGLLFATNATSIFGYAVFSLHPELLSRWPWAQTIFQSSYSFFSRVQILFAALTLFFILTAHTKMKWLPSFLGIVLVSLISELAGTTYGIPFGKYEYTALLGPMVLDRVPYLIPLSWFFMSVASYAIALLVLGRGATRWLVIPSASILLLTWDLTLDPAMSHLAPFWVWAEVGSYYGTPLMNLLGWFVTGLANMAVLEWLGAREWLRPVPSKDLIVFYFANLSLPLGIVLCAQVWQPVLLSLAVYGCYFSAWASRRQNEIFVPNPL